MRRPRVERYAHHWRDDGIGGDCIYAFPDGTPCAYPKPHRIHTPTDAATRLDGEGSSDADRIDAAIIAHLDAGNVTVSANDIRHALDGIEDRTLIGHRFGAARASGVLAFTEGADAYIPSTAGRGTVKAYRPGPIYQRKGTQ